MADRADVGISDGTQTPSLFADCHNPPTVQSALPSAASLATLRSQSKLQGLVYDILPSTTAVFSYAIGSRKLSANEQFLDAPTVVSLLQRTQIKQSVSFIAANKVYTSTNKTTIV